MSTRTISKEEPTLKSYLVPADIRSINFFDGARLSATVPMVESPIPREVTQVLFPDGTAIFVFDKKVSAVKHGSKVEVADIMQDRMPPEEFAKWLERRKEAEGVPPEAGEQRYEVRHMMMRVIEWVWWEVSW